jgi:hypothetical protein
VTRRAAPSVAKLALHIALWLPACFAAWYFGARYLAPIVGNAAVVLVDLVRPGLVAALERQDVALVFVTSIEVHPQHGQTGVLLIDVNPLLYIAGLPLFLALMLASRPRWWTPLAGVLLLLPFQAWGIAFDFLVHVAVKAGPEVSARAGLLGWRAEVIALSYQLGSLVFPALAPVALWMAFNRPLLADLVRRRPDEPIPAVK